MKKKASTGKGKPPRKNMKTRAATKRPEHTKVAPGLPPTARVSATHHCRYLPDVSQFPAASTISAKLPSPANFSGPITLARHFGTRGTNWPREFRRTPFRPGRARKMGLLSALAWLLSSPVLWVPRMVYGIAKGFRNAVSQEQRNLVEELLALRMRLETGEITQAEFQRARARIEPAWEEPAEKMARLPKRKRPKED